MATWVTDVQHLPPQEEAGIPAAARLRADFVRQIVEAATASLTPTPWQSAVRCIGRRPTRCNGCIQVRSLGRGSIEWECADCGEEGTVTGYVGSPADLSRYRPRGKLVRWGFSQVEGELLREVTPDVPELNAVVSRASPASKARELLFLEATVSELDAMYTLVDDLTDGTRSPRKRLLLDGLRASLCTAIDGF